MVHQTNQVVRTTLKRPSENTAIKENQGESMNQQGFIQDFELGGNRIVAG